MVAHSESPHNLLALLLGPLDDFSQVETQEVPDFAVGDSPLVLHDVKRADLDLEKCRTLVRRH